MTNILWSLDPIINTDYLSSWTIDIWAKATSICSTLDCFLYNGLNLNVNLFLLLTMKLRVAHDGWSLCIALLHTFPNALENNTLSDIKYGKGWTSRKVILMQTAIRSKQLWKTYNNATEAVLFRLLRTKLFYAVILTGWQVWRWLFRPYLPGSSQYYDMYRAVYVVNESTIYIIHTLNSFQKK